MDSQSDKRRVTQIRWPDAKQGPYLISGQWRWLQGRWRMVGYSQTLAIEKDLRELQTEDSRALRLPAIRTLSAVELRRQLEDDGAELAGLPSPPPSSRQFRFSAIGSLLGSLLQYLHGKCGNAGDHY